ncbi:unnamed protein product [Lepeophtheirus salmonis]|uniref:(salmon louse) hypothetical protein n=1 Tax=Lepeophtheirus salmonis TaxID=72036 RepID=A0A7R8CJ81_LEPSM|nr:unnamed protein product [Lepeophtheirus salmonis]CAF2808499.1 unnamed protein product [Lepeophtheirus salmonis]
MARGELKPPKPGGDGTFEWQSWDKESTPLSPRDKEAKFIAKPQEKFSEWYKGFKDLSMEGGRFKSWTDGSTNSAVLGVEHVKQEDEGSYKCIISNEHGESEHEFNIYVTVEGGMDFRAMLMKRKKPQKKVVEKFEWIEEPVDRNVKQGTSDEVSFSCKLSHKGKKGKWVYEESGMLQGCVIRECNDMTCKAYLEVEPKVKLHCKVDNDDCRVKWYKDGEEIKPSDTRFHIERDGGFCNLVIREAEISDTGKYTCKIEEFAKDGEGETSCDVTIGEFPHKFTSELKGKNVVEDDQAVFQIEVENEDAEVTWLKDGVPIVADGKRVQIIKEGKKRKLIINKCKLEDAGNITVQTNADSSSADLNVNYNNGFKKGMREFKQCVERDSIIFNVEVKDPNSPVDFFINGENINDIPGARIETKDLGDGKHQLIINKADMKDNGTKRGKQSELEIFVENDGKILKIRKDVQLTVHGDSIQLDVINPKREKWGTYKVIMKNAQGSDETLINVNIMDAPTPPINVYVDTVFQDNMTVHWGPPKDNGGTDVKKYIIEALDTTSGNSHWTTVGQTATGSERAYKVDHLTPIHKYRFRVCAANKIGQSNPTEMSGDAILTKDPWDEPDPCDNDGVAPITHYVIEYKEKNMTDWAEGKSLTVAEVESMGNLVKGKQDGLIEGCEFQFRFLLLKGDGMHDITLKKGRPIRYDLWFGGEPAPTVEWLRDGRPIPTDKDTSIELYSKNAIYTEKNTPNRDQDTGVYTICLTCESGTFEASEKSMSWIWQPPLDDGGTPITGYIVRYMDIDSGEWVTACTSSGCNATAKGLIPGHLDQFEVSAINKEGQSAPIFTTDPILLENPMMNYGGRPISHYIIQKKDKLGGCFDALVTDDHNCVITIDDLEARVAGLSEGKWYQFRVIAVNKSGESDPSPETRPHLCFFPSIDKGQAGSKTVRTNPTAFRQIKCGGESSPKFTWIHPHHGVISTNNSFMVITEEYQGAENRNGVETVDLDLIVLDTLPECECDMYRSGNKQCSCTHSYTGPDEHIKHLLGIALPEF